MMAFASDLHMPGAYHFADGQTPTGQPLSHTMVRPPMSPSASSSVYNLTKSTASLFSDTMGVTPGTKRKRTGLRESTPVPDWMTMDGTGDVREEGKIRYTLAGQIETPGGDVPSAGFGTLDESIYSDVNYRRELGPKRGRDEFDSPSSDQQGETGQSNNTTQKGGWMAVAPLALLTIGGVVGKVWQFCKTGAFRGFQAGGGKAYEMPGSSTEEDDVKSGRSWPNEQGLPTPFSDVDTPSHGPSVPGHFPKSNFTYFPDYNEASSAECTPRPAAKRRQVSHSKETQDDLIRNWVVVGDQPILPDPAFAAQEVKPVLQSKASAASFTRPASRASAPRPSLRAAPRYSTPTTASSRRINAPVSRLSTASQPTPTNKRASLRQSTSQASFIPRSPAAAASTASFRAPSPSPASPSLIPVPTHASSGSVGPNPFAAPTIASQSRIPSRPSSRASLSSRCASPLPIQTTRANMSHRRNQSSASAASVSVSSPLARRKTSSGLGSRQPDIKVDSPRLTAEAKQLATKKMLAEREADVKMEVFNRRLVDMIRQGKEALGSRIDVEMEEEGDMVTPGWVDDD